MTLIHYARSFCGALSIRTVCSRFCRRDRAYQLLVVASVIPGVMTSRSLVQAAPVTFAFDATVTTVFDGNPFNVPFDYNVGDTFRGMFTFEPTSGIGAGDNTIFAEQMLPLGFHIDGHSLTNPMYGIRVANDTAIDDSEFPEPVDVIRLGCAEPECTPELLTLPGYEPFRVRSRMEFVGFGPVLDTPQIPATLEVWNALTLQRTIILDFDNVGIGSMGLQATVGDLGVVPEPSSLVGGLVVVAIMQSSLAACRRIRIAA
jgi:hypothetical protein